MYAFRKSIALTKHSFTKFIIAKPHHVKIFIPNLQKIGKELWKGGVEIHFQKYDCNEADFHEIRACLTTFCTELQYRI